jgi:hypothetical protein
MNKWIEVTVHASRVYMVEIEANDEEPEKTAINLAIHEDFSGDFDQATSKVVGTHPDEIERHKRHANTVIPF